MTGSSSNSLVHQYEERLSWRQISGAFSLESGEPCRLTDSPYGLYAFWLWRFFFLMCLIRLWCVFRLLSVSLRESMNYPDDTPFPLWDYLNHFTTPLVTLLMAGSLKCLNFWIPQPVHLPNPKVLNPSALHCTPTDIWSPVPQVFILFIAVSETFLLQQICPPSSTQILQLLLFFKHIWNLENIPLCDCMLDIFNLVIWLIANFVVAIYVCLCKDFLCTN